MFIKQNGAVNGWKTRIGDRAQSALKKRDLLYLYLVTL